MNREIKFRVFNTEHKEMIILENSGLQYFDFEGSYSLGFTVDGYQGFWAHEQYDSATKKAAKFPIMQFTGLHDCEGTEIFEGDVILRRRPFRLSQTHRGDNIPLGSYTEPLEPCINEEWFVVKYNNGRFYLEEHGYDYYTSWGKQEAIEAFGSNGNWEGEDGDLAFLLEEYGYETEEELIKSLGVFVKGNIYDPPQEWEND